MADIAALGIEVDSDKVRIANAELRQMPASASAAERAVQKFNQSSQAAGRTTEDFSRKIRRMIKDYEFEAQQLSRTAAEREKANALRRAGVTAASAEGKAILASVAALQAQRAAIASSTSSVTLKDRAVGMLWTSLGRLTAMFALTTLAYKAFEAANEAANFGEMADQVGMSVRGLQALRYAAVQNNLGLEQLDTGIAKFNQKIGDASEGNKEVLETFDRLKVKVLDTNGSLRPTEEVMVDVARAINEIDDPAKKAAAAVDFFGKTGFRFIPLLNEVAKGFDYLGVSAQKGIIPDATVTKLDQAADRLERWKIEHKAAFANAAADILDYANKAEAWFEKIFPSDQRSLASRRETWQQPIEDFFDWLGDKTKEGVAYGAKFAAEFVAAFQNLPDLLKAIFIDAMNKIAGAIEDGLEQIRQAIAGSKMLNNIGGWFGKKYELWDPVKIGRIDPGPPQVPGASAAYNNAIITAGQAAYDNVMNGTPNAVNQRALQRNLAGQGGIQARGAPGLYGGYNSNSNRTSGASNPPPKATGNDPYQKLITQSQQYVLQKQAETEAIGKNVREAALLKHTQELLSKAANDNIQLGPQQTQALRDQAQAMADADAVYASTKFMDDSITKAEEFIEQQRIERETLFMSSEAALAYRYEMEFLNAAKRQGIELSIEEKRRLQETAAEMAKQKSNVDALKEALDFGKEVWKGFFSDIREGLMQGKSLWQSFGNAAMNALNRIAQKLLEYAATKLWEAAFPGGGGGGAGGLTGLIMNALGLGGGGGTLMAFGGSAGGFFSGGAGLGNSLGGSLALFASKGAVLSQGNAVRFANGGVVSSPTMFPMSNGRTGMAGEAGHEAFFPLKRTPSGKLGLEASGGSQGGTTVIRLEVSGNNEWVRVIARDESGRVVAEAAPKIEDSAVKKANQNVVPTMRRHESQGGGDDWRTRLGG